jgi:hypothetical protein
VFAGENFIDMVAMLEQFSLTVRFPQRWAAAGSSDG